MRFSQMFAGIAANSKLLLDFGVLYYLKRFKHFLKKYTFCEIEFKNEKFYIF